MANKACVLDSSVAVKWFTNEHDSNEALRLLEHLHEKNVTVVLPDLIFYEIANSLRWNSHFTAEDVEEALKAFAGFGFSVQVPTLELFKEAISCAYSTGCTVYDAIFLALAEEYTGILITSDEKFAKQAKGENVILLKDALSVF